MNYCEPKDERGGVVDVLAVEEVVPGVGDDVVGLVESLVVSGGVSVISAAVVPAIALIVVLGLSANTWNLQMDDA